MFSVPDDILSRSPLFEAPTGPVWRVEADEIDVEGAASRYLVRRLGTAKEMLSTGAVLRHSAEIDQPQCIPVAFWAKADEGVWIATPCPTGAPLAEVSLPRKSWSETLDLWRPLAETIRAAHRRGIVHGNLHPWSIWYDEAANRLLAVDAGTWIGDEFPPAVWWPPELRYEPSQRTPTVATDVHALARLLLYLSLPEGVAEESKPNLEGVPAYAIPAIDRALRTDPDARVQRIDELLAATSPAPTHARVEAPADDDTSADILFGRVYEREELEHERLGEGLKFFVSYPAYDDFGAHMGTDTVGAFFYEGAGAEVFDSVRWAWEGAELNLLDAKFVEKSSGERFVTAGPSTLPVLEPHWPVAVTNVLKAQGCASRYLVDLRDSGSSNHYLVFGILVHGLLDDLTGTDPPTFEEAYSDRVPKLRLGMLAAGMTDDDVDRFETDAREHFANLAGFTRGREGEAGRVGWTGENVEVTRYSSIYGLEGRIDLVTEDETAGLHIVELKSGSARDEHLSQVRAYRLLWEGLARKRDLPISGFLLYSRTGMLRSTPFEDVRRERALLRARNELVACHRSFFDSRLTYRPPHFMEVPRNCNASACRFRKDRCAHQTEVLGLVPHTEAEEAVREGFWKGVDPELVDRAWRYWRHFARLIELENWAENEAVGAILQSGRLGERLANHRAAAEMKLADVDVGSGHITFEGEHPRIFSSGDQILAHRGDFQGSHILRGRYVSSSSNHVTFWTQGAPNAESLEEEGWILDILPVRIGYRTAHRALYQFLDHRDEAKLEVLLRPDSDDAAVGVSPQREPELLPQTLEVLNDTQIEAVRRGLTTPAGCLIQGPPGTGKTTVIAHLVGELVARGKRVIVSAQTNTAVDTMLRNLLDVGVSDFLRLGHSRRSSHLRAALERAGEDPTEHFSRDLGEKTETLADLATKIASFPVIGCTTYKAVRDDVVQFLQRSRDEVPFDVAIVDEATQITEPMTLAPLRLAERFVLVGDHRQLPPIVQNELATNAHVSGLLSGEETGPEGLVSRADESQVALFNDSVEGTASPERGGEEDDDMKLGGLDRSLFERLVDAGLPYVMLERQYRMHRDIMAFSNRLFYDGGLEADAAVADRTLELDANALGRLEAPVAELLEPSQPVVFADVDGEDDGRINVAEADAVAETVKELLAETGGGVSIGVVTPYRAQVQLIRRRLEEISDVAGRIEVDTVERYQGSERDVIIVSLVKTDHPGDFLADERRLNVTLTRARKKLILFGSADCLRLSPLYRDLLEQPETSLVAWDANES